MHLLTWVDFGLIGYVPNTLYNKVASICLALIEFGLPDIFYAAMHLQFRYKIDDENEHAKDFYPVRA
jgi:hypothetical protein